MMTSQKKSAMKQNISRAESVSAYRMTDMMTLALIAHPIYRPCCMEIHDMHKGGGMGGTLKCPPGNQRVLKCPLAWQNTLDCPLGWLQHDKLPSWKQKKLA